MERGAEGGAGAEEPDEDEPESPALEQGGIGTDAVKKPSGSTDDSCHQRERVRQSRERGIEQEGGRERDACGLNDVCWEGCKT